VEICPVNKCESIQIPILSRGYADGFAATIVDCFGLYTCFYEIFVSVSAKLCDGGTAEPEL
jgi:hypothetical protein